MCFVVYIGTNKELELGTFVPEQTDIYFGKISEEEEKSLRSKFSKPNIYHVGSSTNCSCGLAFDSSYFDEPSSEEEKKSPAKFIEFLKQMTVTEDIEYYCCWFDEWELPTEVVEIDIRKVFLDKNYFSLHEREFIRFTRQVR